MNRRELMVLSGMSLVGRRSLAQAPPAHGSGRSKFEAPPGSPPMILLKDYRPKSLYRVPETDIKRAKYPIIDAHFLGARPIEQLV